MFGLPASFFVSWHNKPMDEITARRTMVLALAFEGGLGAAALFIGWLIGHWPAIGMSAASDSTAGQVTAIAWGLVATLPLIALLVLLDRFPIGPLKELQKIAHEFIARLFAGASVLQLAIVSLAAGLGEELLFRGLVQAGLSAWIGGKYGAWIALAIASLVFGVCHWLNTTYAVLAALAGLYFGLLLLATGSLWTPAIAHAAYDFIALVYLVRPNHLLRSTVLSSGPTGPPA
jgi:membrane protease YdiL (CAAX protease family)